MAVTLHHLIIPAKDKRASAQLFAEIFGLTVKPAEGRFAQVPLDEHLTIDFADDEHTRGILHFVPEQRLLPIGALDIPDVIRFIRSA